jgi:hypothetical protein
MQAFATGFPTWAIALVLAVVAPFCARALGNSFEQRARARTVKALARMPRSRQPS